jgi:hypothetical protein
MQLRISLAMTRIAPERPATPLNGSAVVFSRDRCVEILRRL